jgi:hypothetical protein
MNMPKVMCIACEKEILGRDEPCDCDAAESLRELVELKRMKDAGGGPDYERRKAIAWRNAFRVCGVVEVPKP